MPRRELTPGGRFPETFGALLRRHRIAAGLSQEALAERAGLSPGAINLLERGARRAPYEATVRGLADALGLQGADRAAFEAAVVRSRQPRGAGFRSLPPQSRLPRPLSQLVDREHELEAVVGLLRRPEVRLLTLIGPAGVGKTRLALEAAGRLAVERHNSVAFVPLDDVSDPTLVLRTIAQALGFPPENGVPFTDLLVLRLYEIRLLLVLDTCDYAVGAAPDLAAVLARCSGLQILAASRTPLRVRGEWRYLLRPLPRPARSWLMRPIVHLDRRPLSELARVPSVDLFLQRIAEASPEFALTDQNAEAVANIADRLDGLPLAIELAAQTGAALTPWALLEQLYRGPLVLGNGPRDLPPRLRTLRDAIAWSYNQISPEQQRVFRGLAVFPASFTLETCVSVLTGSAPEPGRADPDGAPVESPLLDHLAALVERSLLQADANPDGSPSYLMLDSYRQFAAEAAAMRGEIEELRRRLTDVVFHLAETAFPHLIGPDQRAWLSRLDESQPNIAAVLTWAADEAQVERGGELLWRLWRWFLRARASEGRDHAENLLRASGAAAPAVRAKLLFLSGSLSVVAGDQARARRALDESATIWRDSGEWRERGLTLAWLALARLSDPDGGALDAANESLALLLRTGDRWGTAKAKLFLGAANAAHGNVDLVEALYSEGSDEFEALGDGEMALFGWIWLATLYLDRSSTRAAVPLLDRSITVCRGLNVDHLAAPLAALKGRAAGLSGDLDSAAHEYETGMRLARQSGDLATVALCLDGLAWIANERGRHRRSARFAAAATELRNLTPTTLFPGQATNMIRAADAPKTGPPLYFDQVIEEALREAIEG